MGGPESKMTGALIRKEDRETHTGRRLRGHGGRDWGYIAAGKPKNTSNHQELGRGREGFSWLLWSLQTEHGPNDILTLEF